VQIEAAKIEGAKKNGGGQSKQDNKGKPADSQRSPDANTISGLLLGSPEFQRR
jgi:hypothetical protein